MRYATLIRVGQRVESCAAGLERLYPLACALCPDGFPAEETRELDLLREHVTLAFVDALRREVAASTGMPNEWLSLDRFTLHGCGPVSLHDDRHNYPGVYFVIIVVHSGRLGIVDATSRACRHALGEIVLLDPHKKHALVPEGLKARQHPYERSHGAVGRDEDRFMFVGFDVPRPLLRGWFRLQEGQATA